MTGISDSPASAMIRKYSAYYDKLDGNAKKRYDRKLYIPHWSEYWWPVHLTSLGIGSEMEESTWVERRQEHNRDYRMGTCQIVTKQATQNTMKTDDPTTDVKASIHTSLSPEDFTVVFELTENYTTKLNTKSRSSKKFQHYSDTLVRATPQITTLRQKMSSILANTNP